MRGYGISKQPERRKQFHKAGLDPNKSRRYTQINSITSYFFLYNSKKKCEMHLKIFQFLFPGGFLTIFYFGCGPGVWMCSWYSDKVTTTIKFNKNDKRPTLHEFIVFCPGLSKLDSCVFTKHIANNQKVHDFGMEISALCLNHRTSKIAVKAYVNFNANIIILVPNDETNPNFRNTKIITCDSISPSFRTFLVSNCEKIITEYKMV